LVQSAHGSAIAILPPVANADGRLGLCDVLAGSSKLGTSWAAMAYNAGARINRWEFRWDRLEKKRGVWNFSADDPVVASDSANQLSTLGILIGTPGWAVASGKRPGNGVPAGLYRDPSDPRNLWAAYVRGTVRHYAGQVSTWEVWNEPDLSFFWSGNARDYFRLLKVADLVIASVDPSAKVSAAGMVAPDLQFFTRVLQIARADPGWQANHGYFDVTAWHAYGPARLLYDNVTRIRTVLNDYGYLGTPIWITEDGFPSSNPNGEPRQAAYVLQTIVYALAAGASKVFVYRASDDPLPKTWGLISAAGLPRQGYVAFQVAARFLSGTRVPAYAPTDQLERFTFYAATTRVTILWNHSTQDRTVNVDAAGPSATLIDWTGALTILQSVNGQFRLSLPGAAYNAGVDTQGKVVGGPPELLLEDNIVPTGIAGTSYISPLTGISRRLLLFNDGSMPETAVVASTLRSKQREVVQLAPASSKSIDLDLLSGEGYGGAYRISSTSTISGAAVSDRASSLPTSASPIWSIASSVHNVTISNPAPRPTQAQVMAYGRHGRLVAHSSLRLQAFGSAAWHVPTAFRLASLSLSVEAPGGVVVSPFDSRAAAQPSPQNTWYAIKPETSLRLFNPSATATAHTSVRFLGSEAVQSEQVVLLPHHTAQISTQHASEATLSSDSGIVAGYSSPATHSGLVAAANTRVSLTSTPAAPNVAVFNPGETAAHVSLDVVNKQSVKTLTAVVPPGAVSSIAVQSKSDAPRGVILTSDLPVAASPLS